MIRCCPLTPADFVYLQQFRDKVFPNNWSDTQLQQQLSGNQRYSLGAWQSDRLVGVVLLSLMLDEAELLQIAVASDQRGKGIGSELFGYALKELRGTQVTRLLLEVRASNQVAIALYEGAGMHKDGRRKGYYPALVGGEAREDALLLSLDLTAD